ncbi:MAG: transglycosylase SLT domain-containing protein [Pyrinomonadaceae bacterium]
MSANSVKTEYLPEQRAGIGVQRANVSSSGKFQVVSEDDRTRANVRTFVTKEDSGQESTEWLRRRTVEELKTIIRAIGLGVTDDWQLTDLIFYARHPELKGTPLTNENKHLLDEWNSISAYIVHPTLSEIENPENASAILAAGDYKADFERSVDAAPPERISAGSLNGFTTKYDEIIANAVGWCPGLEPEILKSLLAQESAFNPSVINKYGYAGIAQFGRTAAREVGLNVGVAGTAQDERLNPEKAIPGAARLLKIKADRLDQSAFSKYGKPQGIEFWKFVAAAYNGGEGTVTVAMGHAYRVGLELAQNKGLTGREAVSHARNYASRWENLKHGGMDSPLAIAAKRFFPNIAAQKYREIGNYPTMIIARVAG